jgi:exonuclease VII large subunit
MTADSSLPPDNFEGEIKQARENFRKITELKEKLDILTEHVESRKEALEEEIEESLHEAVRNGRDSLEKIQENIDPKLEKVIRAKLEEIDKKMNRWKEDNALAVKEAIKLETPAMTKTILWELDQIIVEKVKQVKTAIMESVAEEVNSQVGDALKEFKEETDQNFQRVGKFNIVCLLLASLALGGLLLVASRF